MMIRRFCQIHRVAVVVLAASALVCRAAAASEPAGEDVAGAEEAAAGPATEEPAVADQATTEQSSGKSVVENRSPWDLNAGLDTGLVVGSAVLLSIELVFKNQNRGPSCGAACDPMSVNPWERHITGWYNPDAARASDVLLGVSIGLPFLAGLIDTGVSKPVDGWRGFGKDVLVLTETWMVTTGITNFLKYSIGRVRPYAYNDSLPVEKRTELDAGLSFPSGHTSQSFAMATSWSWLYMKRHPNSPAVIPIWIGSYAIAATTAVLRPVAGKHFWTDVVAGAALGISMGLLVPWLHELIAKKNRASGRVNFSVLPTVMEGGGGACVTLTE